MVVAIGRGGRFELFETAWEEESTSITVMLGVQERTEREDGRRRSSEVSERGDRFPMQECCVQAPA